MSESIEIVLNGEPRAIAPHSTVADLLASLALPGERVAVEVNRRVIRKVDWAGSGLAAGDRIEIVHFVGGG